MGVIVSNFVDRLVGDEIRRIVKNALAGTGVLSAPEAAAQIIRLYPKCGLDANALADQIMMIAADVGLAVEFGSRKPPAKRSRAKVPPRASASRLYH
jgi:hypothetical protein